MFVHDRARREGTRHGSGRANLRRGLSDPTMDDRRDVPEVRDKARSARYVARGSTGQHRGHAGSNGSAVVVLQCGSGALKFSGPIGAITRRYSPNGGEESRMQKRSELWKRYDAEVSRFAAIILPSAFVQEERLGGLWNVQVLKRPIVPMFGCVRRIFFDPPSPDKYEPFYNAWPMDHRGWMQFETKEDARDFYQFEMGNISSAEFSARNSAKNLAPWSGKTIHLDNSGNFIHPQTG